MGYLLHHVLTESAAQLPDHEAVRFEGQSMTYAELDASSDRLAQSLRAVGVQRGDRVGLYFSKSLASVIGVFGVMKAGGVYVPLDAAAPPSRAAYIARDCNIRVLVTSARVEGLGDLLAGETPIEAMVFADHEPAHGLPVLQTVTWAEVLEQEADLTPPVSAIETDLAFILYTSGSTGEPKGVMIAHRTVLTFIEWSCNTFALRPGDRVTSHAPLHFDLSTFDVYATIKAGATVVLVPERLSVFPVQLVELLSDERITVTYLVPSILSLIVSFGQLESHDLSDLRAVLFAGEVFPVKYLRRLMEALPQPRYFNLYGPTETNVCTYYQVRPKDIAPEERRPVPIGIACENTEIFVVDDVQRLVTASGREGELWVRGSAVAYGYWGDDAKTARSFVANPFQPQLHETVYRTGDLVTLDEDGVNWRYVGRRDHMVKSRGYRIELGEIEATLYGHPDVGEAAAVAVPDDLIGTRIIAYVVPTSSALTAQMLQTHCGRTLPRYMVPERIELCDHLPKTSTGKVDRPSLANVR